MTATPRSGYAPALATSPGPGPCSRRCNKTPSGPLPGPTCRGARMEAVSFIVFAALCDAGNAIAGQRERFDPSTDQWLALTELLCGVDSLVDQLVLSDVIEEPDVA